MLRLPSGLHAVSRDTRGNVALIFALGLPLFFGGMAIAVDSSALYRMQGHMQSIADTAALSTAKEISIYGTKTEELEAAGRDRVLTLLDQAKLGDSDPDVDVVVDEEAGTARVDISLVGKSILPVAVFAENPIKVAAQARTYGALRLCVLTLNPDGSEVLRAKESGILSAPECGVQSNSVSTSSIHSETGGTVVSEQICSSGGLSGPATAFQPGPALTDCPAMPDPLSSRAAPLFGSCNHRNLRVNGGTKTIYPGVYCGGITLSGSAVVTAEPGIYVITDGNVDVSGDATLQGEHVGFYFQGSKAWFHFRDRSTIELSAPKDGPMAGVLFFEDRTAKAGRNFSIESGNVRKLIGTIYLPKGTLNIEAKGSVAAESAYTVIIARKLDLKAAKLVMNTDYGLTDVPLPPGMSKGTGEIQLTN